MKKDTIEKICFMVSVFCIIFFCFTVTCHSAPVPVPIYIKFAWPGDDSLTGLCTGIDFRTASDSATIINWNNARLVIIDLSPKLPGTVDSVAIDTLFKTETVYYIAGKAFDEVPNYSQLSNICLLYVADNKAPSPIIITIKLR